MSRATSELVAAYLGQMELEQLRQLVRLELRQRAEEGCDVDGYAQGIGETSSRTALINSYLELLDAARAREFSFSEPEDLAAIRRERPAGPRASRLELSPEGLYDRIHGGWLGRVAGCLLGKPVEPWGYREKIAEYLKQAQSYPLSNYFPRLDPAPEGLSLAPADWYLGSIDGAPEDDDTDYSILGLHILETCGTAFSTAEVAAEWLGHLAIHRTYTAERAAYRNLVMGIPVEQVARTLNPEREYIGARIRIDPYGLAAPGQPELAAEMAYRDASLSHTKNGIYSAMFTAACIAWAFVTDDIHEILQVGLSEIPANCRLAQAVHEVMAIQQKTQDWEATYERIKPVYGHYDPVHAINNHLLMVLGMLAGAGDFEKTICTAVMCGLDTDCNGANAGTILGVIAGAKGLPEKWTAPLKDRLRSSVAGFAERRISDLARRTTELALKNLAIV